MHLESKPTCEHCGTSFTPHPQSKSPRFCSRPCIMRFEAARRIRPFEERFWEKVDRTGDCWLWTGALDLDGYGYIMRGAKALGGIRAPRAAWELHFGAIPAGLLVCHHCDNPRCVRPNHLFLGTPQENMDDMWRKGRARPTGRAKHLS